jgi:membrane-associated phospholipid phosphatase
MRVTSADCHEPVTGIFAGIVTEPGHCEDDPGTSAFDADLVVSDVLRPVRLEERTRFLSGALVCLLGFWLTWFLFVWTRAGQRMDQRLLSGVRGESARLEPARTLLSFVGSPVVLFGLLAGVLVVGVLSGRARAALAGAAVVGGSIVAARVLKTVLSRPDLDVAGSTTHNSFPSGHVTAAAAVVFAVLLVLPARARWWCAAPGAVAVVAVGVATMIAGWHRVSDVVGAVSLVAALGCAAAWAVGERRRGV